jgi:hypothetical protein
MKRNGSGPTVPENLPLRHEAVGAAHILTSRSGLTRPILRRQPTLLLDYEQDTLARDVAWQMTPGRGWRRPVSQALPHPGGSCPGSLPPSFGAIDQHTRPDSLLAREDWNPTLLLAPERGDQSRWARLRRIVNLSVLGWAFVLAAVLWELFAIAFSRCAGWGWDRGAFFFVWGLGVLAFGFYLRIGRRRSGVSGLFLGMNILVLGVFSLVLATR